MHRPNCRVGNNSICGCGSTHELIHIFASWSSAEKTWVYCVCFLWYGTRYTHKTRQCRLSTQYRLCHFICASSRKTNTQSEQKYTQQHLAAQKKLKRTFLFVIPQRVGVSPKRKIRIQLETQSSIIFNKNDQTYPMCWMPLFAIAGEVRSSFSTGFGTTVLIRWFSSGKIPNFFVNSLTHWSFTFVPLLIFTISWAHFRLQSPDDSIYSDLSFCFWFFFLFKLITVDNHRLFVNVRCISMRNKIRDRFKRFETLSFFENICYQRFTQFSMLLFIWPSSTGLHNSNLYDSILHFVVRDLMLCYSYTLRIEYYDAAQIYLR